MEELKFQGILRIRHFLKDFQIDLQIADVYIYVTKIVVACVLNSGSFLGTNRCCFLHGKPGEHGLVIGLLTSLVFVGNVASFPLRLCIAIQKSMMSWSSELVTPE